MGLGEVRCCADVADWARLNNIYPSFDTIERKAVVKYNRFTFEGNVKQELFEEVIEW